MGFLTGRSFYFYLNTKACSESKQSTVSARKDRFGWRSHEVTRIEAFSDAVFAFAVTLLIVSLEVPKSFEELLEGMRSFRPFALCFAMIFQAWMTQNIFFRRYGLSDNATMVLNAMLLFMLLFFVYPLKFLFTGLILHGRLTFSNPDQARGLFYIYGAGFSSIYLLFTAMYWHAFRQRHHLELSGSEVFETKTNIYRNFVMACIGLLSIFFALLGYKYLTFSWAVYILTGPAIALTHGRHGKIHRLKYGAIQDEHV